MTDAALGFRLPRLCLPRPGVDLARWAVVACDQYTSEPDYWQRVEQLVGDAPSTLQLIFPEVHLAAPDAQARIQRIQASMRQYLAAGLLQEHQGLLLVERTVHGQTRRGLMLELDLEHYNFDVGSTSLIRPTEGTIVERLAPRIAVRSGAELELPHVLVLIDDPQGTVIEPIAAALHAQQGHAPLVSAHATVQKPGLLYASDLMLGGGHVAGYAVNDVQAAAAMQALLVLANPAAFAARYGVAADTPPMLFAVGDGNHSLATAKSIWEQAKHQVGPEHPSRYALVEVENIHDPALHFAPIHRLLFGVSADFRQALATAFGRRFSCTDVADAAAMRQQVQAATPERQVVGVLGPGQRCSVITITEPPAALAVGTLQPLIDDFVGRGGATSLDYVHGDDVLERLAQQEGMLGLHFAPVNKSELLRWVVHHGPLPRKTFSMGEAHEKRFYVEARRIRSTAQSH